jgi:hypothetical protein
MHQLELRLLLVLCGVAVSAVGLVIATNFRGFTVWHAKWSVGMLRRPTEERVARQAALERFLGVVFTGGGVIMIITSFFAHFRTS